MSIISLYLVSSAGGWNKNISRSVKEGREGRGRSQHSDEIQSQKFIPETENLRRVVIVVPT